MKKVAALGVCCVLAASIAFAADEAAEGAVKVEKKGGLNSYFGHVTHKFKTGGTNLLRSPTEFYFQPVEAKNRSGKDIAMLWPGIGEACGMALTRFFGGGIDLVTCPLPFPNKWTPILDE